MTGRGLFLALVLAGVAAQAGAPDTSVRPVARAGTDARQPSLQVPVNDEGTVVLAVAEAPGIMIGKWFVMFRSCYENY